MTERIRWSFVQLCCAISLVCPVIATPRTYQFWEHSESVNMPKTIESPAKCGVHAVIWFLYSEQVTRNVVLRYCPSSWQCSAAATKRLLKCLITHHHSPGLCSLWFSPLSSYEMVIGGQHFWHNELQTSIENWLKAQVAGFYDEDIGKWYHATKNVYNRASTM